MNMHKNIEVIENPSLPDLSYERSPNEKDVSTYIKSLDQYVLEAKANVKNIAITSSFAGGKSTVIHYYLKTLGQEPTNTVLSRDENVKNLAKQVSPIVISLKTLADVNTESNEENCQKVEGLVEEQEHLKNCHEGELQDIETGILHQMLHRLSAKSSKLIRNKELFTPNDFKLRVYVTAFFWFISALFILFEPGISISRLLDQLAGNNPLWSTSKLIFSSCIYLFFITSSGLLIKPVINTITKFKIANLSVGPLEASFNRGEQSKFVIDNKIEELIYYFKESKVNLVVFEDIDRFVNPAIFLKLTEINKIINDASDVGTSSVKDAPAVKFIYAIKDELFTSSDLTKLFEAIIPIVPVMAKSNALSIFQSELSKLNLLVDFSDNNQKFLRALAVYFKNPREIKQVIVEYYHYKAIVFHDQVSTTDEHKQLLALMIYKVMFSSDFEKLHKGKGYLAELFYKVDCERLNIIERLENKHETIKEQLNEINILNDVENSEEQLVEIYRDGIAAIEKLYDCKIISINGQVTHGLNAETIDQMNGAITEDLESIPEDSFDNHELTIDELLSENELFNSRINVWKKRVSTEVKEKSKQLKKIDEELKFIRTASVHGVINYKNTKNKLYKIYQYQYWMEQKLNSAQASEVMYVNELMDYLITRGYLNERFEMYTGKRGSGALSEKQEKFVRNVLNGFEGSPEEVIHNLHDDNVLNILGPKEYSSPAFVNYKLLTYLCSNVTKDRKYEDIVHHMIQGAMKRKNYLELLKWVDLTSKLTSIIIDEINSYQTNVVDEVICSPNIMVKTRDELIKNVFIYKSTLSDSDKFSIKNFYETRPELIKTTDDDKFFETLRNSNVAVEPSKKLLDEQVQIIAKQDLFKTSLKTMKFISDISPRKAFPYSHLYEPNDVFNLESDYIKIAESFYKNKIKEIINQLLNNRIKLGSESDYIHLLSHEDMEPDDYVPLLQKLPRILSKRPTSTKVAVDALLFQLGLIEYNANNVMVLLKDHLDCSVDYFFSIDTKRATRTNLKDLRSEIEELEETKADKIQSYLVTAYSNNSFSFPIFKLLVKSAGRFVETSKLEDHKLSYEECEFILKINHIRLNPTNFEFVNNNYPDLVHHFTTFYSDEFYQDLYLEQLSFKQLSELTKKNLSADILNLILSYLSKEQFLGFNYSKVRDVVQNFDPTELEISTNLYGRILRSIKSTDDRITFLIERLNLFDLNQIKVLLIWCGGEYARMTKSTAKNKRFLSNTKTNVFLYNELYELGYTVDFIDDQKASKSKRFWVKWRT